VSSRGGTAAAAPPVDEALQGMAQAGAHLDFAQQLVARYAWSEAKGAELRQALDRIRRRRADPGLYLAVVGEFSSGKSTMINALLRKNLLPASVVQATTAAATMLRQGSVDGLIVKHRNGREESLQFPNGRDGAGGWRASFAAALAHFCAVEGVARDVELVTVTTPAAVLEDGLVIVDTPGTNVDNPRHVETAIWALRELCDAALVVVSANIPLSQSFADFLSRHLADCLHRCVFVVTMIDLVPPAERDDVVRSIVRRLRAMLGVERPVVLAVSPNAVLAGPSAGEAEDARAELRSGFAAAEQTVLAILRRERTLLVLERLAQLLSALFADLNSGLDQERLSCAADARALTENRIPDLAAYSQQEKATHRETLEAAQNRLLTGARAQLQKVASDLRGEIQGALGRAKADVDLRQVLEAKVPAALAAAKAKVAVGLDARLDELRRTTAGCIAAFDRDFVARYSSLAALAGDASVRLHGGGSAVLVREDATALAGLAGLAKADEKFDNVVIGGGMAAGAVWGTFVIPIPVVGTVVGALLGAVGGALFSPSIEKRRAKYWAAAEPVIASFCSSAEVAIGATLARASGQAAQALAGRIDAYVAQYATLVKKLTAEQAQREAELRDRQRQVEADLAELALHESNLSALAAGLRRLHER
jgi:hypothetical protein